MRAPEDNLAVRVPPLEEAPWANSSCLWSDIEQAMKNLPCRDGQILFMTLCLGEGSWRNGMKRYNWREKVGDYFGITGGDVNKVVGSALKEMCDFLNTDTINEVSRGIRSAGGGPDKTVVDNAPVSV